MEQNFFCFIKGNINMLLINCNPALMPFFAPSPRGDFIFWVTRTRKANPSAARDPCHTKLA